jgi:hypothetical protein
VLPLLEDTQNSFAFFRSSLVCSLHSLPVNSSTASTECLREGTVIITFGANSDGYATATNQILFWCGNQTE